MNANVYNIRVGPAVEALGDHPSMDLSETEAKDEADNSMNMLREYRRKSNLGPVSRALLNLFSSTR